MKSILKLREQLYEWKLLRSLRLPVFVISVGNISVGGTGKSPLSMLIARWALEKSLKPLVLTRGYARKGKEAVLVHAHEAPSTAEKMGDEPLMMKLRNPGVSILVHSQRAKKALELWHAITANVVIMDDAFQHWQAVRDLDIVLWDATDQWTEKLLPFGRLREPLESLSRADIVIITRANEARPETLAQIQNRLAAIPQQKKSWQRLPTKIRERAVFQVQYSPVGIYNAAGEKVGAAEDLKAYPLLLVSGIAKPESFRRSVESIGRLGSSSSKADGKADAKANIIAELHFRDHQFLSTADIEKICVLFDKHSEQKPMLLITEKDWVRWREDFSRWPVAPHFLRVDFEFVGKQSEADFFQLLNEYYECITQ
jgi:tetraacyldisaccharide 4'-kinase